MTRASGPPYLNDLPKIKRADLKMSVVFWCKKKKKKKENDRVPQGSLRLYI